MRRKRMNSLQRMSWLSSPASAGVPSGFKRRIKRMNYVGARLLRHHGRNH